MKSTSSGEARREWQERPRYEVSLDCTHGLSTWLDDITRAAGTGLQRFSRDAYCGAGQRGRRGGGICDECRARRFFAPARSTFCNATFHQYSRRLRHREGLCYGARRQEMLSGNYRRSRNSSTAKPHGLRISDSVPLASSPCMGTTVLKTRSLVCFSNDTCLPFWRNSMKPPGFSARTTRSPETLGSFGILVRDVDGVPERFTLRSRTLGGTPGLQVEPNRFAKPRTRTLH